MTNNKVIVISGPSGTGKTTLIKQMLSLFPVLSFSISATTRPKRKDETDNKDYYFLSLNEFKIKLSNYEFIEYQEVYADIFYGTLKFEIDRIWQTNKIPILDIDVYGAINVKNQYKEQALTIFIHPGDVSNLENRLITRNTESPEALSLRLSKAEKEISEAIHFDKVINNTGTLEESIREVKLFIEEFINRVE